MTAHRARRWLVVNGLIAVVLVLVAVAVAGTR